jgi:hypothetical protein
MSWGDKMTRPKKNEADLRRKWPVLNPTAQERAAITRYAADVGLSVSAYLIGCGLRRPTSPRQDWLRILARQQQLATLLEDIATEIADRTSRLEAGRLLLSLHRIESQIDGFLPQYPQALPEVDDRTC